VKYKIELTRDAQLDLLAIADFYQQTAGDDVAKRILATIQTALVSLVELPTRGHKPHELYTLQAAAELQIVVDRYRIIYLLQHEIVYVIAVFDGRQDVRTHLAKRRSRLYQRN
jgi:plasmid stabilization system protein ParE